MAELPTGQIELGYKPRKHFVDFHGRSKKRAILVLHRGAGKTVAALNELITRAIRCKNPNPQYAYIAPELKQAKTVVWRQLKAFAQPVTRKVSEAELYVELINGAQIRLIGADNPDALRGMYLDGAVLDEVAQMKRSVWFEIVQPIIMRRGGWAVFIGTPKGRDFFYQLWQAAEKQPEKWFALNLTVYDTDVFTAKQIEETKEETDDESFRQEYLCDFAAGVKGTYYSSIIEKMQEDGRLNPVRHVKAAPVDVVFDIGVSDDTSAWFFQIVNGRLLVLNHFSESGLSLETTIEKVNQIASENGYKLDRWCVPHDAASREWQTGKTVVEQLWSRGITVVSIPRESVQAGIQAVRSTLPKMWIDGEKCAEGIEALKAYQKKWDDRRGVFSKEPLHDWSSHSADAMRYLCFVVKDRDIDASKPKKSESGPSDITQVSGLPNKEMQIWNGMVQVLDVTQEELDWLYNQSSQHVYERI